MYNLGVVLGDVPSVASSMHNQYGACTSVMLRCDL